VKGKQCVHGIVTYISNHIACCFTLLLASNKELVYDCSVKNVPFPALESFEDRKTFPKRYFLFFDIFFRAGRHNRYLWKNAIQENKGLNDKRFGPAIFEAHVRTTIRENYFKWIFQQLTDIEDVEDKDVHAFQMEYDESIYSELPRTLVCTHKDLTKFPVKNCEIYYGKDFLNEGQEKDDDNCSYCSANTSDEDGLVSTINNQDFVEAQQGDDVGRKFFLVYRNVNPSQFNAIREQQRNELKNLIEKSKDQHKDILLHLKETINKIRDVKRTLSDTDPRYKEVIAEAKKKLRLFKDPYEEDDEGQVKKKRRRSIENQTRFSDSKVTFFSKSNEDMKREEQEGMRKSWETLYKEIWNKHLLTPKTPVIDIPIPQVHSMIRDMEDDVNQLLADCNGIVEEV
jgi:hypothetical protein